MRRRLLWTILPYYVAILIVSLLATGYYWSRQMRGAYLDQVTSELESRAYLVNHQLDSLVGTGDFARLDAECKTLGQLAQTRITVVAADGVVLGDSERDPHGMENHSLRPEIVTALEGGVGSSLRYSATLHREMRYVAIPMRRDGNVVAAVRTSIPATQINRALSSMITGIVIAGSLVLILAALVGGMVIDRLLKPLRTLRSGADRIAGGDFAVRVPVSDSEEIGALADAMNNMAKQLERRIRTISEQRNEREAILDSMTEGVLALDSSGKIISMNPAAAEFFHADIESARGRMLTEVVRSSELYELAHEALAATEIVEHEIELPGDRPRYLRVKGAALTDDRGRLGAVLVANDISRLKQLERVRRDFVANVSHELRTPITAIIGSIETLLEGDVSRAEDMRRFLEIVSKHAERLRMIVEDLMRLSRLENETEGSGLQLQMGSIDSVVAAAVAVCDQKSKAAKVRVEAATNSGLRGKIDAGKLEQAVINLLDNAIGASEAGSVVKVGARVEGDEIVIEVADSGVGIESRHLPRLFERFYRVDSARSRARGGTGLGLAIVKHTAIGHGGRVSVESKWGHGSTFRIWLPRPTGAGE